MRKIDCNICVCEDIPIINTLKIDEKIYCTSCFEKYFSDEKDLANKSVEKEMEPTVCYSCAKDFGDEK